MGPTPVRLNGFEETDATVEVVWARRQSPVTARIDSIPTLATKFRFGDVVLHDGAPTGTRIGANGREYSVFNVFELFTPSDFVTFEVVLDAPDEAAVAALDKECQVAGVEFEDWAANMRVLCKACSEGRAHQQHDHAIADDQWKIRRRVGIATRKPEELDALLDRWCNADHSRNVESIEY